jgi:Cu(I)/Ag(I) efflux system membrane fusion protein
MKCTNPSFIVAPFAALLLVSCSEPAPEGGAEHTAEGTLNSVDSAAGMINISHDPVVSASWPAMTMSFKLADPKAAAELTPGQRVEFHFTIESGMSATVTEISAAE